MMLKIAARSLKKQEKKKYRLPSQSPVRFIWLNKTKSTAHVTRSSWFVTEGSNGLSCPCRLATTLRLHGFLRRQRLRPLFLIAKIALIAARLLASLDFTSAIQYMINSRPKTYRRQNVKQRSTNVRNVDEVYAARLVFSIAWETRRVLHPCNVQFEIPVCNFLSSILERREKFAVISVSTHNCRRVRD